MTEQKTVVLFHSKDSVNVGLTQSYLSVGIMERSKSYVLNRGEYVYFFHEARNLLPILGFYDLTSDLSTTSTVHSQMDGRKASTSQAV